MHDKSWITPFSCSVPRICTAMSAIGSSDCIGYVPVLMLRRADHVLSLLTRFFAVISFFFPLYTSMRRRRTSYWSLLGKAKRTPHLTVRSAERRVGKEGRTEQRCTHGK